MDRVMAGLATSGSLVGSAISSRPCRLGGYLSGNGKQSVKQLVLIKNPLKFARYRPRETARARACHSKSSNCCVPAPPRGREAEFQAPRDAGVRAGFCRSACQLKTWSIRPPIARARRAAEAASERLDLVLVKLGLISESDLCIAYATYCRSSRGRRRQISRISPCWLIG